MIKTIIKRLICQHRYKETGGIKSFCYGMYRIYVCTKCDREKYHRIAERT